MSNTLYTPEELIILAEEYTKHSVSSLYSNAGILDYFKSKSEGLSSEELEKQNQERDALIEHFKDKGFDILHGTKKLKKYISYDFAFPSSDPHVTDGKSHLSVESVDDVKESLKMLAYELQKGKKSGDKKAIKWYNRPDNVVVNDFLQIVRVKHPESNFDKNDIKSLMNNRNLRDELSREQLIELGEEDPIELGMKEYMESRKMGFDRNMNIMNVFGSKSSKNSESKEKNRGKCIFPAEHAKVKDKKDHFPMNDSNQARNALARANQYSSPPPWWRGTLKELVSTVAKAVHKEYPSIHISKSSKNPGKN